MERKIGEIFEYNGEWYQCVVAIQGCRECSFRTHDYCTHHLECLLNTRSDRTSVIFKKLEKVGEPYTTSNDKVMQNYLIETEVSEYPRDIFILTNYEQRIIAIEIKQTKEDMEENKLNLKPFDIQKAREGKPVCTRDGRKARIICFDANIMPGNKNILALIGKDDESEYVEYYTSNGEFSDLKDDINDLMMLPEKKEGWANIYKSGECYNVGDFSFSKEEVKQHKIKNNYIATVKISWEE